DVRHTRQRDFKEWGRHHEWRATFVFYTAARRMTMPRSGIGPPTPPRAGSRFRLHEAADHEVAPPLVVVLGLLLGAPRVPGDRAVLLAAVEAEDAFPESGRKAPLLLVP